MILSPSFRLIAGIICAASLAGNSGCVSFTHYDPATTRAPKTDLLKVPNRGVKGGDWALALSGGGIRSALFGLGVVKALYDQDILPEVDVVSSNSGGSYTSYLLYTRFIDDERNGRGAKFGESVFAEGHWTRTLAGLQAQGNFVTVWEMTKVAPQPARANQEMYEEHIVRYGRPNPLAVILPGEVERARAFQLKELQPYILSEKVPNLIVEAKVWLARSDRQPRASGVLEINPWYIGNQALGYHAWEGQKSLSFSRAVAISGAAIPCLQAHKIANPFTPQGPLLTVADGGGAENLAAYPLLLRGFDNVVIVDGVQDANYSFSDYHHLRRMLDEKGIHLCIPELDRIEKNGSKNPADWITEHAVNKGTVTYPTGRVGTVFYVKMGRPKGLFHQTVDARGNSVLRVNPTDEQARQEWRGLTRKPDNHSQRVDPAQWADSNYRITKAALASEVEDYANWLDRFDLRQLYKMPGKFVPFLAYYFPHMTTIDQSFHIDQVAALVGLGYLQASAFDFKRGELAQR